MKFTAYYRVSTKQQGKSGLGLDAQKEAVRRYVTGKGEAVPPPFVEIESGKKNDRPVLKQAIEHCKANKTTLLIAKLDRLSRNAAFLLNLQDELQRSGVSFVACDMPEANNLTIGIMAVMAQDEARRTINSAFQNTPNASNQLPSHLRSLMSVEDMRGGAA